MIHCRIILSMVVNGYVFHFILFIYLFYFYLFIYLFIYFCLMDRVSDLVVLNITVVVSRLTGIWLNYRV